MYNLLLERETILSHFSTGRTQSATAVLSREVMGVKGFPWLPVLLVLRVLLLALLVLLCYCWCCCATTGAATRDQEVVGGCEGSLPGQEVFSLTHLLIELEEEDPLTDTHNQLGRSHKNGASQCNQRCPLLKCSTFLPSSLCMITPGYLFILR